jgi:hypothetical protein
VYIPVPGIERLNQSATETTKKIILKKKNSERSILIVLISNKTKTGFPVGATIYGTLTNDRMTFCRFTLLAAFV